MSNFSFGHLCACLLLVSSAVTSHAAAAQKSFPLQIEVLIQPDPNYKVHTLAWARVFQLINRSPRFRTGRSGETTGVEETDYLGRKGVRIVGIMNRTGSISFTGRTFNTEQPEQLEAWLKKLEEFGAKGPPDESPTWGLSDDDFKRVLNLLAPAVTDPIDLRSADAAIKSLKLPAKFSVTFSEQADKRRLLPAAKMGDIPLNCKGLSKGTALAMTLAQFGLGFRPTNPADDRPRSSDEQGFVLEIHVGDEADNLYPIGWKPMAPIFNVIPAIGKTVPVDLEKADLHLIIELIAQKLEVPFAYAAWPLLREGRDISKTTYSRKPDKLSIDSLMRIVGRAHEIGLSLRTDEAGSVFLWVTTEANFEAFRQRFAHIRPAP